MLFGTFITPSAERPGRVVALAQLTEEVGLDLVTVQDHPYQARFLDTWTLLSVIAAKTSTVRVSPNVANLPLRPPAVLAKSAASLDLLTGGRVELGLGAGAFWDAIGAMGGRRLEPRQGVEALEEAIRVIREMWDVTKRSVRVDGEHYRVHGAHPGPAPAHDIGIWLGAYKPKMLALTGRLADGWLPSSGYAPPETLGELNKRIDDAAASVGRDPSAIRRLYNITPEFTAAQLAELAQEHGVSAFILASDDPDEIRRWAAEVVPLVKELVGSTAVAAEPETAWDESTRPVGPSSGQTRPGAGMHLIEVHDHLREELTTVKRLIEEVTLGTMDPGIARSHINTMTMRQNNWTMGTYCESYCRIVTTHHTLEDQSVFPHLRRADPALGPVLDRLSAEHLVIHDVLESVDRALVKYIADNDGGKALQAAVEELTDTLLSHLSYEERELVEPLSRLGFY
jgi:hemerythrin-like domain-containing protein